VDDKPAAKALRELLAHPPTDRYSLLELSVEWDGLEDIRSRFAAALRLFLITKYPLDWLGDRDHAWVTANADGDTLELSLYVALDEIRRRLRSTDSDLPSAIGPLAERVVVAATHNQGIVLAGGYAEIAFRGEISRLLDTDAGEAGPSLGTPRVSVRSDGWEPIGLGAIQDLVQEAFGPVDLDRSLVALPPATAPGAGCPACAGSRFGFPRNSPRPCRRCAPIIRRRHNVSPSRESVVLARATSRECARSRSAPPGSATVPIPAAASRYLSVAAPIRAVTIRARVEVAGSTRTTAGADQAETGRSHWRRRSRADPLRPASWRTIATARPDASARRAVGDSFATIATMCAPLHEVAAPGAKRPCRAQPYRLEPRTRSCHGIMAGLPSRCTLALRQKWRTGAALGGTDLLAVAGRRIRGAS